ncbi:hypothetical protein H1R20_g16270, partial [Candolleomyces eurysporus]
MLPEEQLPAFLEIPIPAQEMPTSLDEIEKLIDLAVRHLDALSKKLNALEVTDPLASPLFDKKRNVVSNLRRLRLKKTNLAKATKKNQRSKVAQIAQAAQAKVVQATQSLKRSLSPHPPGSKPGLGKRKRTVSGTSVSTLTDLEDAPRPTDGERMAMEEPSTEADPTAMDVDPRSLEFEKEKTSEQEVTTEPHDTEADKTGAPSGSPKLSIPPPDPTLPQEEPQSDAKPTPPPAGGEQIFGTVTRLR